MASLFEPNDLWQILNQTQTAPEWVPYNPGSSASGEYDYGYNRLIAPPVQNPRNQTTLAHELTHALSYNLLRPMASDLQDRKWNREQPSQIENQFLDAMQKVYGQSFGRVGQIERGATERDAAYRKRGLASLFQDDDARYRSYRTDPEELMAFGVGGTVRGGGDYLPQTKGNPHLNPTAATELSILLDLYKRLPEQQRKRVAEQRRQSIDERRKAKPWSLQDLVQSMDINPFK